jgi:hypothetical protein
VLKSWEDIIVGTETGQVDFVVTDEMVDQYLGAVELDDRWLQGLDGGARVAPLDLVPKMAMRTLFIEYAFANIGPSIRVKQAYKFLKPVKIGTRVRATGRIADKYEKRDKRFVAFEAVFEDEAGTPLIRDNRAIMVLGENFKMKE